MKWHAAKMAEHNGFWRIVMSYARVRADPVKRARYPVKRARLDAMPSGIVKHVYAITIARPPASLSDCCFSML